MYEYWEVLSLPSVYFNREFLYIVVALDRIAASIFKNVWPFFPQLNSFIANIAENALELGGQKLHFNAHTAKNNKNVGYNSV